MRIDATVIGVASLDDAVAFWTRTAGMEIVNSERGWVEVQHPTSGQRLRLVPDYGFIQSVSVQTDDLDGTIAAMERQLGATLITAGPTVECAQLEDRFGVRYGICQPA